MNTLRFSDSVLVLVFVPVVVVEHESSCGVSIDKMSSIGNDGILCTFDDDEEYGFPGRVVDGVGLAFL